MSLKIFEEKDTICCSIFRIYRQSERSPVGERVTSRSGNLKGDCEHATDVKEGLWHADVLDGSAQLLPNGVGLRQ